MACLFYLITSNFYKIYEEPLTWSSATSTQRMENGGSRLANPRSGGLEQLVTNWNQECKVKNISHIGYGHRGVAVLLPGNKTAAPLWPDPYHYHQLQMYQNLMSLVTRLTNGRRPQWQNKYTCIKLFQCLFEYNRPKQHFDHWNQLWFLTTMNKYKQLTISSRKIALNPLWNCLIFLGTIFINHVYFTSYEKPRHI